MGKTKGGRLIGLCGLDGSGKTTLSNGLQSQLRAQGLRVALIHFWPALPALPGGRGRRQPGGVEALSPLPWWKALGLWGLLRLLIWLTLRPTLRNHDIVLCDRYAVDLSTYLTLRGRPRLGARLAARCPRADAVLWLRADPVVLGARKRLEHAPSVYRRWNDLYEEWLRGVEGVVGIDAGAGADLAMSQAVEGLKRLSLWPQASVGEDQ